MLRSALSARNLLKLASLCAGLLPVLPVCGPAFAHHESFAPARVVSINLCTDQMAMLLAGDGQLVSVSNLAADPAVSAMAEEARGYRLNHGLAEEVFLMKPDLVLAGSYTTRETVDLLKRLGISVAEFAPEASLEDVRENLLRMGHLLGHEQAAERLVEDMDRARAALLAKPAGGGTAALYYANGYTSGENTLAGDLVADAGLDNIGIDAGIDGLGRLPLERLIMAAPDVIVGGDSGYDAPALAEAPFAHPAFLSAVEAAEFVDLPSRLTICGGPFNLEAISRLKGDIPDASGNGTEPNEQGNKADGQMSAADPRFSEWQIRSRGAGND
ncbi:ABC transporter substrate-binding protein [Martelella radicis]|uniref:Iron complex transport system substrate-binding protein n=1 Tax=Martelella radicis TaxID=1397476 RepID=A0A7W6KNL0_9HYPH|nr:ABC transporter substrate-binding protein [Martelella radicis]MBB4123098.1 iron complex transport system substrate-binding protein [Martelella radicis]